MIERYINIILFLLTFVFWNCNRLILHEPMKLAATTSNTNRNNTERTDVAHDTVKPPLTVAWNYDAMAGFSAHAGIVEDSILFVANLRGEVHAIHSRTGKGLGKYDFGSSIIGLPIVDGQFLYVALTRNEENLIAYNLHNGTVRWHIKIGDVETSPLLVGNRLYITTLDGKLICVEKATGEIMWTYEVPQHDRLKFICSSPASNENIIVLGCDDGNVYAVGIENGKLLWRSTTNCSITASPSINNGKVFVGSHDGSFYAFDLQTGKQIWMKPLGSKIYSSQSVSSQFVYIGTAGGFVYCLDGETGTTVWQTQTNSVINATPVLSGNVLYVGCTDKILYAFDAMTGNILWQYKAEGRIKTMPVIAKHYVFLFVEDRSVIALKEEEAK